MSIIDQKAREVTRPALEAVCRTLARWNVTPGMVTYFGLVLTVGVAALAVLGEMFWAGVAYIFAGLFDGLDGTLARVSGKGSRYGAFLDSTIDRFEESIVFLGLIAYYARAGGELEVIFILATTVGSLMVSYTRARAEAVGVACQVGFMTRIPRVTILIVGLILNQVLIALIILTATTLFTAFHRMYDVWKKTDGEEGGWGLPHEPFVTSGFEVVQDEERGEGA
jgi:CDP-diacylglycerol--glycerol-3-phosphate 3-phosphatidyltransferase